MHLDVILSPAELPALARRDLRRTVCVVFDILRATSTFVTALHHGAAAIIPVGEISEAVALRHEHPDFLLAGERAGVKIRAGQSGGVDFDLGNSPREFTPETVRGRTIVSTTTNGTRALRACTGARAVLAGTLLNLTATAVYLQRLNPAEILLVCAGTGEGVALEDVLAAGALAELLPGGPSDAAQIARQTYAGAKTDLVAALGRSQNGTRLCTLPELRDDVAYCGRRDQVPLVALADAQGWLHAAA
jgi:2-phosphosulfolactate phosphatase